MCVLVQLFWNCVILLLLRWLTSRCRGPTLNLIHRARITLWKIIGVRANITCKFCRNDTVWKAGGWHVCSAVWHRSVCIIRCLGWSSLDLVFYKVLSSNLCYRQGNLSWLYTRLYEGTKKLMFLKSIEDLQNYHQGCPSIKLSWIQFPLLWNRINLIVLFFKFFYIS